MIAERLPALLVELHRDPAQVPVYPLVEGALVDRTVCPRKESLQSRARDGATFLKAHGSELIVRMQRQSFAPVDVLVGPAAWDRLDEMDAGCVPEDLEVIRDV